MPDPFDVSLKHLKGYQFLVDFGTGLPDLLTDEPNPIGTGEGPSPEQMLTAAVANCLCGSLVFALGKYRQEVRGLGATARCRVARNAEGRLRVEAIDVEIVLALEAVQADRLDKVLSQFRKFCTVSESVEAGVPVRVTLRDGAGGRLAWPAGDPPAEAGRSTP
ncbi:OsmC family protein [Methylobacterium sp. 4-46]|uniref:OsmC family protein n=1 Tax=unclassified Methylobacterium TaxID=2615210 RepID=UPI000165C91A|nr:MULTISPECIES: OsmC family protein [Methylobacterium]ACA18156.1 OsmC family protein [Methylobacterium sp. 4-46]WFT77453.1 OsmC family protein [Methylobacterium nodulans]